MLLAGFQKKKERKTEIYYFTNLLFLTTMIHLKIKKFIHPMYCIYPFIISHLFTHLFLPFLLQAFIHSFYYNHIFTHFYYNNFAHILTTLLPFLPFLLQEFIRSFYCNHIFTHFYYNNFASFHIYPPCIALPFIQLLCFNYIFLFLLFNNSMLLLLQYVYFFLFSELGD